MKTSICRNYLGEAVIDLQPETEGDELILNEFVINSRKPEYFISIGAITGTKIERVSVVLAKKD